MPTFEPNYNAPKLRAYLQRRTGNRVLLMEKWIWNEIEQQQSGTFEVEVGLFPMANVKDITRVASIAKRIDSDEYEIKVYREDLKDAKPINVDNYALHENLKLQPDYDELIKNATTSDDENMHRFLNECVIIEIKERENDHHLNYGELPDIIGYRFID